MGEDGSATLVAEFDRSAQQFASRVAVSDGSVRLSYGELLRRSNAVANGLLARFGPSSEPVMLFTTPNLDSVAVILGVMKAGKCFALVDPANPRERLRNLHEVLGSRIILADRPTLPEVDRELFPQAAVLTMDDLADGNPDCRPSSSPAPEDPAWVAFTSGSTGHPKGILQSHDRAVRMTRDYIRLCGLNSDDRVTVFHPGLTWDLFGSLLCGASLHRYDLRQRGLAGVGDWVEQTGITFFRAFPSSHRQIVDALGSRVLKSVRLIHLGGEQIYPTDLEGIRRNFSPNCSALIVYGSNEAGLVSAVRIGHGDPLDSPVPVGHPAEYAEVRLIDGSGAPVDDGIGEIAVSSPHLFRGYWRRPDLTDAALRRLDGDDRLFFLTGDLATRRPDGQLLFAGRKDFQVKVRGYRIELEEIEQALLAVPGVRQAAVRAFLRETGEYRLVAYYSRTGSPGGELLREGEIRAKLAGVLAPEAVPDRFLELPALPATPNGKVDRQALPDLDRVRPAVSVPFRDPSSPLEQSLADRFQRVLKLDRVGADDSFFELGGKSLAALQLLAEVGSEYGLDLSPTAFLGAPTVAGLANEILAQATARVPDQDLAALLAEVEAGD